MLWRALILTLLSALPLHGEEVVAGLSQARVSINTTFSGSEILIFGAVKREAPLPTTDLDVIVTVSSPLAPVTVRKKDRRLGIWVNTDSAQIDYAPSFYAVRATKALSEILAPAQDFEYGISIPRAIRASRAQIVTPQSSEFLQALIRIRSNEGAYQQAPNSIELTEDTLFRANIALPANLTEGDYKTRIFLLRNNQVIDAYETTIDVRKVGLERWIYNLAHQQPLLYGLLSLALAIAAGWSASAVFRLFRG
ncbi:hypothetical protein ATO10_04727 [Actibacterium atlanticum]|uniref:Transmembrane protein n=1 Tax=Actibacterium atlanticum TaxID=1461693 RepID=A0A058ZNS9_9RHOB|nr:TIGR02186 family protein [Actibacterium atlanticum]KCV82885.1 hypothetical protein ATO10_04727 [Actibacterium atlanticum]